MATILNIIKDLFRYNVLLLRLCATRAGYAHKMYLFVCVQFSIFVFSILLCCSAAHCSSDCTLFFFAGFLWSLHWRCCCINCLFSELQGGELVISLHFFFYIITGLITIEPSNQKFVFVFNIDASKEFIHIRMCVIVRMSYEHGTFEILWMQSYLKKWRIVLTKTYKIWAIFWRHLSPYLSHKLRCHVNFRKQYRTIAIFDAQNTVHIISIFGFRTHIIINSYVNIVITKMAISSVCFVYLPVTIRLNSVQHTRCTMFDWCKTQREKSEMKLHAK